MGRYLHGEGAGMAELIVCREQVGALSVQVGTSCESEGSGLVCQFSELVNCLVDDADCGQMLVDCLHVAEMHIGMNCTGDGDRDDPCKHDTCGALLTYVQPISPGARSAGQCTAGSSPGLLLSAYGA
eukprot:COSAG02_NODE_5476_length_4292_cov_23.188409_2_plen_127_part_00